MAPMESVFVVVHLLAVGHLSKVDVCSHCGLNHVQTTHTPKTVKSIIWKCSF